ncbi:serine/threonine protein kinase [Labilithrix luteola]|uniref:serine/threonine protein kinase n=1 Tax=Labilithrix luteola TaxID=1391654 RepID=UPI000A920BF2|nr:serine/threonine-protein kinase [Labilithrix luteola]
MTQAPDPRAVPLRDSLAGRVLHGSGNVSYHLRECIGEGGQGWVFRANWDDPSGHVVIVKVLRPDVVSTEALRRFQREAEVLRMLSTQGRPNPYIVRFYDHAVAQVPSPFNQETIAFPFTVLEYVDGTTLEKVLLDQKGRGLSADRARRLLRQMCQALDVVHAQKVVHRDLKPSNILLATEAGTEIAKVTDFGLVKLVDMNLARTAALAGASLGYAPPEQYEQGNQRVSPRTDVFSLAAVTFEMLAGKPAFPFTEGENPLLIVTRILNGPRPSLMKTRATLAPEIESSTPTIEALDRELAKALSADPKARHESVMDFWSAIQNALRAIEGDKSHHHTPPRRTPPLEVTAKMPAKTPSDPHRPAAPKSGPRPDEAIASNPASWTWSILSGPIPGQTIRAATFSPSGDKGIAITSGGILRWDHHSWTPAVMPSAVSGSAVRGVRWLRDASALLFGEGGLVARVTPSGAVDVWRVPDPEITFHGAFVDDSGITTLVGERPYRGFAQRSVHGSTAGVVTQFSGDRLTVMGDAVNCARLHSVTRLPVGDLLACGDSGTLVRVELGVVEQIGSVCDGHLLSIAPLASGGALTVGAGGHALSIGAKLEAKLEPVQTTRDMLTVVTTDDGQAWAGSMQARLLRRGAASTWVRMSGDIGVTASMIALHARSTSVRAIGDDGTVVEGRLA